MGIKINEEHKDRVFKFLFGNPAHKDWTLDLYNAINDSHHTNPEDVEFNTIEAAVYLGMKNDVSFIIVDEMNLWEHQSTFNPNMPMRFFIYAAKLYEKYTAGSDYYMYGTRLQSAPSAKCVCFYNGTAEQPESQILRLSSAFGVESDIEVCVKMLNINYGKNKKIMQKCQPLNEYSFLVDKIRTYQKELKNLEAALDAAIDDMPESFLIKKFLLEHRAEVKGMFLTEYNQEKVLEQARREERKYALLEGQRIGKRIGERNFAHSVASDMLRAGEPLEKIMMYSKLAEGNIRKIANEIGIVI